MATKLNGVQFDKSLLVSDAFSEQFIEIESLIKEEKFDNAKEILDELIKKHTDSRELQLVVPLLKVCMKDFEGAYRATLALTPEERCHQQIKNIIQGSIVLIEFKEYIPQAESDLDWLIKENLVTTEEYYRVAQQLIAFKLGFDAKQISLDLEKLKNESLLLRMLTIAPIPSAAVCQAVQMIRSKLLTYSLAEMELPDDMVELAQALAEQARLKAFSLEESEVEIELIDQLLVMLEQALSVEEFNPTDVEGLFLLLCMYRRLSDLSIRDKLRCLAIDAWPESLKGLLAKSLYND